MTKSYVTLEQHVCPACGTTFDTGSLLLDRRLRDRFEMKTVTGMELCPEHQQKVDEGYVILVEIDPAKSQGYLHSKKPQDVWRTGPIVYLKREAAAQIMPTIGDNPLAWIDADVTAKLKEMAP